MYLLLAHPVHAKLNCKICMRYLHDNEFKPVTRGGKLVIRSHRQPPLCCFGPDKCPKGNPDGLTELTPRNFRAYIHYLECKAVGQFPDDAIVRRNAAAIRHAEEQFERKVQAETIARRVGA